MSVLPARVSPSTLRTLVRSPSTLLPWIALALLPGCYLAHERGDLGPPPDPVPPSFCPTPSGGSGLELVVVHRIAGRRALSIRAEGGELRSVVDELPSSILDSLAVAPGGWHAAVGLWTEEAALVELDRGALHPLATLLPPSAIELCGVGSDLPGRANGFTVRFRPDGGALLYGCSRYSDAGTASPRACGRSSSSR